jgi:uncharacterized protein (TIGR02266 family)
MADASPAGPTAMQRARVLLSTTLRVLQEEPPGPDLEDAVSHLARAVHHIDALEQVRDGKMDVHLDSAGGHASGAMIALRGAAKADDPSERKESLATLQRSIELAMDLIAQLAAQLGCDANATHPELTIPKRPSRAPAAVAPDDKRRATRVHLEIGIGIASESNFYTGLTEDVSAGGLFVATWQPLPIGTEVNLQFILPGDVEVTCHGRVQWLREPRDGDLTPGMGVQFVGIDPESAKIVERFVQKRAALFWDD